MGQYLLSVWHGEDDEVYPDDATMQRAFVQVDRFNEELQASGSWLFAGGLQPASKASVVRATDEGMSVPDGPPAAATQQDGGLRSLEARDPGGASDWGVNMHVDFDVFERLELVPISSNRVLVVISIKSGLVRTIMMEVGSEISRNKLDRLTRFLNERLGGLTMQQLRESFIERVKDVAEEDIKEEKAASETINLADEPLFVWLLRQAVAATAPQDTVLRDYVDAVSGPLSEHLALATAKGGQAFIAARAGELLMLHAGAVAHPVTGRALVFVAPGGTGKSTLTRRLGKRYGYLSDGTVGSSPDTLRIHPNPQPIHTPLSHLVYAANGSQVRQGWVAGRQLLRDGARGRRWVLGGQPLRARLAHLQWLSLIHI